LGSAFGFGVYGAQRCVHGRLQFDTYGADTPAATPATTG
jgi:hypothetical protein